MKALINKHKREIIISFLVSIVCFYIEPVLKYIGQFVVNILTTISTQFSNYYYHSLSQSPTHSNDYLNTALLLIILTIMFMDSYYKTGKYSTKLRNQIQELEEVIAGKEPEPKVPVTKEKVLEEITTDKKFLIKTQRINSGIAILQIIIGLYIMLSSSIKQTVCEQVNSFNNEVTKISPYITDNEIKIIKSKWTMMKNQNDYTQIANFVNAVEKKYNLN